MAPRSMVLAWLAAAAVSMPVAPQAPVAPAAPAPAYWCPMHPDERAPSAATCPICRMKMVPIPPMRVGEYRMDVTPIGAPGNRGLSGFRLALRDPRGALVSDLETVHEQRLHAFIVGRDSGFFRHVHPASDGATLELRMDVPPDEYVVAVDFLPAGGSPQLLHRVVLSPGARPVASRAPRTPASVIVDGVRVRAVSTGFVAGQQSTARFALSSAADGGPITDLEPFLGAGAHLLLVSEDLTEVMHEHAEDAGSESALSFQLTFPRVGQYRAWLQFQRRGAVVTVPFQLAVR